MPTAWSFVHFRLKIIQNINSNMTINFIYQFCVNVNQFYIRKYLHVLRIIPERIC